MPPNRVCNLLSTVSTRKRRENKTCTVYTLYIISAHLVTRVEWHFCIFSFSSVYWKKNFFFLYISILRLLGTNTTVYIINCEIPNATNVNADQRANNSVRERVQKKIYIQQSIQLDKWSGAVDTNVTTSLRSEITERRQAAAVPMIAFICLCFVRCVTGYFFMFLFFLLLRYIFSSFTFALVTALQFCHAAHLSKFHLSQSFRIDRFIFHFTTERKKTQKTIICCNQATKCE